MHVIDVIILVGWVVFWLFWIAASIGVKAGKTRWTQFAGVRVAAILVFLLVFHLRVFKGGGATANPWLQGIGTAIFVLGLALAVWARLYIGRNWGMPMSRKAEPELVTTGPYRTIRHPIYTGIILAMIGTTIAVSLYWLVAVVFAAAYPTYKRSTKMLIPHLI